MKRLIINGDDYGYTPEKSEGILKTHEEGILTSTTVMINIASQQATNKLLRYKKSLGIGLHLNITRGKPASLPKEVLTLINEHQEMFRPQEWTRKSWNDFGNLKNMAEVELEFNNQLKKFKELLGVKPCHLDSHHFITSHKKIFPIMLRLAKENSLPVRLPAWILGENDYPLEPTLVKKSKEYCKTTDHAVFDFFCVKKNPAKELTRSLKQLKEGTTEMMFHPSMFKHDDKNSIYGKIDLDLLTNQKIKKVIKEENIQLISYKEL